MLVHVNDPVTHEKRGPQALGDSHRLGVLLERLRQRLSTLEAPRAPQDRVPDPQASRERFLAGPEMKGIEHRRSGSFSEVPVYDSREAPVVVEQEISRPVVPVKQHSRNSGRAQDRFETRSKIGEGGETTATVGKPGQIPNAPREQKIPGLGVRACPGSAGGGCKAPQKVERQGEWGGGSAFPGIQSGPRDPRQHRLQYIGSAATRPHGDDSGNTGPNVLRQPIRPGDGIEGRCAPPQTLARDLVFRDPDDEGSGLGVQPELKAAGAGLVPARDPGRNTQRACGLPKDVSLDIDQTTVLGIIGCPTSWLGR